ncbi:MAG: alpha/beta hydrolase-fold protein [Chloroflexota bacterium]
MVQRQLVTPLLLFALWIAACSSPEPQNVAMVRDVIPKNQPEQKIILPLSWTLQDTPTPTLPTPTPAPSTMTPTPIPPKPRLPTSTPKPFISKPLTSALILPTAISLAPKVAPPTVAPPQPTTSTINVSATNCKEGKGYAVTDYVASRVTYPSTRVQIYLPPCYSESGARRYPVIYLIHGIGQDETIWASIGAHNIASAQITSGQFPPFIMVMPQERGSTGTTLGRVIVSEIVPYIDSRYRTLAARSHRAIGGISRGANWAIYTSLTYAGIFSKTGIHSVGGITVYEFNAYLDRSPSNLIPSFYIDIGESDGARWTAQSMDRILTQEQIAHDYHTAPGGHTRSYWAAHIGEYLRWYTASW